jgi:hypothetical protein
MRATWLIESGVYGDEVAPLLAEVRRQGMAGEVLPYKALRTGAPAIEVDGKPLAASTCVIGYGTYPFAQQILLHHAWTPGAWCSAANLDCSTYYQHFARFLLNQHHVILTGVEAVRQADTVFARFGRDGAVFARPTSAHKLFVGRCIDRDSFAVALAPTRYDPESRVVIAAPQPIGREWRVIVVGDRVVSGSQYAVTGSRAITPELPEEVRRYAEAILAQVAWRPDSVFMMDLCESDGALRLVELNSFSGSWLYASDLEAVVVSASSLAEATWDRTRSTSPQSPA